MNGILKIAIVSAALAAALVTATEARRTPAIAKGDRLTAASPNSLAQVTANVRVSGRATFAIGGPDHVQV